MARGKQTGIAFLVAVCLFVLPQRAMAGAYLVKDVNTTVRAGSGGGYPSALTALNGVLLFRGTDSSAGSELWSSDGTASGTVMVRDINAGAEGSLPDYLTVVGSTCFFSANDGTRGSELWKTDGTAAGTALVHDICAGSTGSNPRNLAAAGTTLYFAASDGISGTELWKSDGTPAGTVLVKDIAVGAVGSSPSNLTALGNVVFFTASDGINGIELWKSDGTPAGTTMLKDIAPGMAGSSPSNLTIVGTTVFFAASDGTTGVELWRSNGTTAGTVLVRDIRNSGDSSPQYLQAMNGVLYFSATDGINGQELWRSNGTSAGTIMVKNIRAGGDSWPTYLTAIGNTLYFRADDGVNGAELWKSTGTNASTVLVKDIRAGATSCGLQNLVGMGTYLYFAANDGSRGVELWRSDGSAAGTIPVKDIRVLGDSNPSNLKAVGTTLFFSADDGRYGVELWKSNGTADGTLMVRDIMPDVTNSGVALFTRLGNMVLFRADDGTNGSELWKSDGSTDGTTMVKDIRPGFSDSYPAYLTVGENAVYFSADDGVSGSELWKTDGSYDGTTMVADIQAASGGSTPGYLAYVGNTLFFSAFTSTYGRELWKSDGTSSGTMLVKDIMPGTGSANPQWMHGIGDTVFFVANDGVNGQELWKSDGTEAGTVIVKDIRPGIDSSAGYYLTSLGSTLYFRADDGVNGCELWKSDGTLAGTAMVKDIRPGGDSFPSNLMAVGALLFFKADNGVNGQEVWRSDGTIDGTTMVRDIWPGAGSPNVYDLTSLNEELYFSAGTPTAGRELWKSNGTEDGTLMIRDIFPGWEGSGAQDLRGVDADGWVYFQASDGVYGSELWASDGTVGSLGGTFRLTDIAPGTASSSPSYTIDVNGRLLFVATDTSSLGNELWGFSWVPGPPSNARATAVSLTSISWAWNDNSNDETGFKLYVDEGGGPPVTLRTVTAGDSVSWQQTGLDINRQYAFQVAATNSYGDSDRSSVFSTWTSIEAISGLLLSATSPTAITAAPANTLSNLSGGLSGVRFTNVTLGGSSVWRQTASPWASTGLLPNTQYIFEGRSRNGAGIETSPVSGSRFTMAATPAAPFVGNPTPHTLDVSIGTGDGNPAYTLYAIHISPSIEGGIWVQGDGAVGANAVYRTAAQWATTTVRDLAGLTSYSFSVTARNGNGLNTVAGPTASGQTLEAVAPEATISVASNNPTGADEVVFEVTFSEPVAPSFDATDVMAGGTLAGTISVTGTDPAYLVHLTLTDPDSNGYVWLDIGPNVTDAEGNPLESVPTSEVVRVLNWGGFTMEPFDGKRYTGDSHSFIVNTMIPAEGYQWKWEDAGKSVHLGPTESRWELSNLTPDNEGMYWCEVTYDGDVYSTHRANIQVRDHLQAVWLPRPSIKEVGETHVFQVLTSGGYEPLSYTWYKDGQLIPGATGSSLVLFPLQTLDSGSYHVEISDTNTQVMVTPDVTLAVVVELPFTGTATGLLAAVLTVAGVICFRCKSHFRRVLARK